MQRVYALTWLEILLLASTISLVGQLAWPTFLVWKNRPRPGKQVPIELANFDCLLYLPKEYTSLETRWPLLLYLHGAGHRGWDVQILANAGIPARIAQGHHYRAIALSPQCPPNLSWSSQRLLELIEVARSEFKVDRVIATGCSMGGYGTWHLAQAAPSQLSAIAPICGGGNPEQAAAIEQLPIWAFHGSEDDVVPVSETQEMIEAIENAGGAPRVTIYDGRGHDICSLAYANDQLFEWLVAQ